MKVLIVDDDPRLRELLCVALERAGYDVLTAADGQRALVHAAREAPDLIVLDVGLPELDGFEVCRRIRARSNTPILFLTAHDDEVDRILGLELGADDYVTKPFSPRELVARAKAILKRTAGETRADVIRKGRLSLDRNAHLCHVDDMAVAVTAKEFGLLEQFLADPVRVHTKRRLIAALWGDNTAVSDRTLDSHVRNLRRKLAQAGCDGAIETVHGVGMRLGGCS